MSKKPIRIIAVGNPVQDVTANAANIPGLSEMLQKPAYAMDTNGKRNMTKEGDSELFKNLGKIIANSGEGVVTLGGTALNIFTNISRLLKSRVSCSLIGVAANDNYGKELREQLRGDGITLLPKEYPDGAVLETAISYIVNDGDQKKTYAHPGNSDKILKADSLNGVETQDIYFVQGNTRLKTPEIAQPFIDKAVEEKAEIWYSLPTDLEYTANNRKTIKQDIAKADLIFSNEEELVAYFGSGVNTTQEALQKLQKMIFNNRHNKRQVAFITRGEDGAAIITADKIIDVPAMPIDKIASSNGAGDTAYAGFAAAWLSGLDLEKCGQVAMALANGVLRISETKLPDPLDIIDHTLSEASGKIKGGVPSGNITGIRALLREAVASSSSLYAQY